MSIKVSVIIPVYNVEQYLEKCLLSVMNQSLKDIEIIIINDGSPDHSEDIILKYQQNDQRIKYYKQENIGLGPTRNRGIKLSKGEFLAFVDSDDYIDETMLEELYNKAIIEGADIVCGQVCMVYESADKMFTRKDLSNVNSYSLKTQDKKTFVRDYYFGRIYSHNSWDKIYKTKLVKQHNILFGDNKRIFAEDNYFQLQIFEWADKICFVPKNLYYYLQRDQSIMNSYKKDYINRHMNMIVDYEEEFVLPHNNVLNKKICSLVTFDGVIMEALNVVDAKIGFSTFYRSLKNLENNKAFSRQIKFLTKGKASDLEPNQAKKLFIYIISNLIALKAYYLASLLIFSKYNFFRGKI